MNNNETITVAITGASGSMYAIRLIDALLNCKKNVNLIITDAGFLVINEEMDLNWQGKSNIVTEKIREYFRAEEELVYYDNSNFYSPLASGSSGRGTMIICPCSMGTLGRIASGISGNLLERAADVVLKERGNLVIVPRETPLNDIHLENMLKLSRMDARIVPAMPAFYQKPDTMEDLVDFVVGKVLDQIGVEHDLFKRWGS